MGPRAPRALVLENVCGLASSHEGSDFRMVVKCFNELGYSVDAFELNARRWLPQSRPRMFVVGVKKPKIGGQIDTSIRPDRVGWIHAEPELITHVTPVEAPPSLMPDGLTALTEKIDADDPRWWSAERCAAFVDSLSTVQRVRFDALKNTPGAKARTAYRRTRNGKPVWEMREDDIAGCPRTARGGSSKQAIYFLGNENAQIRWMTGREYARLQGADDFKLNGFTEAQIQYAFGDAVAVPAVTWLMKNAVLPCI